MATYPAPYTVTPVRYARTFEAVNLNQYLSPFYFMKAATTGVAGHALRYHTDEDYVDIAVSGMLKHQFAGFLMQDVKNLDGGAIKGYRNPNNTVEQNGGNVGVAQGFVVAFTKQYNGSPARGDRLCVNDSTGNLTIYSSLMTGDPIAVVEATSSSVAPTVEPQQLSSASGNAFIRIKTFNL